MIIITRIFIQDNLSVLIKRTVIKRVLCLFCYYSPRISVYSVKPTPLKVYLHLLMVFFLNLSHKVAKKIDCFSNKHMHPSGSYFSSRRKEAAHCGRFEALETNTNSKMARGRHGCFSPVFHLLCKVSSDYR